MGMADSGAVLDRTRCSPEVLFLTRRAWRYCTPDQPASHRPTTLLLSMTALTAQTQDCRGFRAPDDKSLTSTHPRFATVPLLLHLALISCSSMAGDDGITRAALPWSSSQGL